MCSIKRLDLSKNPSRSANALSELVRKGLIGLIFRHFFDAYVVCSTAAARTDPTNRLVLCIIRAVGNRAALGNRTMLTDVKTQ